MATGSVLPVSLLILVLLILPGLIGLDLYYQFSKRTSSLSRTQLLVYSTGVSLLSTVLLYFSTSFSYEFILELASWFENWASPVTGPDLNDLRISEALLFYFSHILLAGVIGAGVGFYRRDENSDRREPWHYAFNVVPNDGESLEVITKDGMTVEGEFNESAWDEGRRELYLDDPYEVVYEKRDDPDPDRHDLGRSILLHEESIRHVLFTNKDPDRQNVEDDSVDDEQRSSIGFDGADEAEQGSGTLSRVLEDNIRKVQTGLDDFQGDQTGEWEWAEDPEQDEKDESARNGS
jgi:hypothetical protein